MKVITQLLDSNSLLFQEDYGKAREYFSRASELGDLQSKYQLAVIEYDLLAEGCDQVKTLL